MHHVYIQASKPKRRQRILLFICLALAFLLGCWVLLDYGKWRNIYQEMAGAIAQKASNDIEPTENEKRMNTELTNLQRKLVILERTAQVDRAAQNEVRKVISDLENENLELREEVAFYQNIMSATTESRGLNVQGLRVAALKNKQHYKLELILTRIVRGGWQASGKVSMTLQGKANSGEIDYDLKELMIDPDSSLLTFKIKNFKRIEGVFSLPVGFKPERVKVAIKPHEAKLIKKEYLWADILE